MYDTLPTGQINPTTQTSSPLGFTNSFQGRSVERGSSGSSRTSSASSSPESRNAIRNALESLKDVVDILNEVLKPNSVDGSIQGNSSTSLHTAAFNDDINTIISLANTEGVDLDIKDPSGYTPLHWACTQGNLKAVGVLLAYGAKINEQRIGGEAPLHGAIRNHSAKGHLITLLLIKYNAELDIIDDMTRTPLGLAQKQSNKFAKDILEQAKEIASKVRKNFEENLLIELQKQYFIDIGLTQVPTLHDVCLAEELESLIALLVFGLNVNEKDQDGQNPLHIAACLNSDYAPVITRLLLAFNADPKIKNAENKTPLTLAIEKENYAVSEILSKALKEKSK